MRWRRLPDVRSRAQLQSGRIAQPRTGHTMSSQNLRTGRGHRALAVMIVGAATSRVRGRTGRAARQRVAGRTAVSPPERTLLLLLALYACWGSAIPAMKLMVDTV